MNLAEAIVEDLTLTTTSTTKRKEDSCYASE